LKKLLLIIVSIIFVFAVGCEPASNTEQELVNKALFEEVEEMQKEISHLNSELKKLEQQIQSTCSNCGGLGLVVCSYCNGTGNNSFVCYFCKGSGIGGSTGRFACLSCDGRGFKTCSAGCEGTGIFPCNVCRGSGR
jgi:hypothetical protein